MLLQEGQRNRFFSLFYFAINLGSFLSMIVTPAIRGECSSFRLRIESLKDMILYCVVGNKV
jgi:dipeptide/tripeptide permease